MAFSSAGGGVATNNEYIAAYYVNFVKKCGGGLFVKAGNNFGFPLNLNWSSAANIIIAVSGYFVG
jgi:hypothetical protein